jgi:hypothetical protein
MYFFVSAKKFENFIMTFIILNIAAMGSRVRPAPLDEGSWEKQQQDSIFYVNILCNFVFNVEFLLKFFALRLAYFSDNWNRFDFFCVLTADMGLILELVFDVHEFGTITSAIRMFRVIRLFRLVRFLQGLSQL